MKKTGSFPLKKKAHFCEKLKRCATATLAFALAFALGMPVQALGDTTNNTLEVDPVPGVTVNLFNYDATANDIGLGTSGYVFFHTTGDKEGTDYDDPDDKGFTVDGVGASGRNTYNKPNMASELGTDGYPVVNANNVPKVGADGKVVKDDEGNTVTENKGLVSLDYLFDTSGKYKRADGQPYHQATMEDGGGLFKVVDGYYVYDSGQNAAYYDEATNKFKLYDNLILRPWYTNEDSLGRELLKAEWGNFLPFNEVTSETAAVDSELYDGVQTARLLADNKVSTAEDVDLWFGMTVDFEFFMPQGGMMPDETTSDPDDTAPMVFDFHGDDDVFVYIDGVLVLNIGGTHASQDGWINFATGEVYDPTCADGEVKYLDEIYKAAKGDDYNPDHFNGHTFANYSEHTLKFFYMERGGNISYCRLKYNMPILSGDLNVIKQVDEKTLTEASIDNEYEFVLYQVSQDSGSEETVKTPVENCSYTITRGDGTTLPAQATGVGEDAGKFSLKANEVASFHFDTEDGDMLEKQYLVEELVDETGMSKATKRETVIVDTCENHHTHSSVSTDNPYDSGEFTMKADQRVEVVFENTLVENLEITKFVTGGADNDAKAENWDFEITLSGDILENVAKSAEGDSAATSGNKAIALEYDIVDAEGNVVEAENEILFTEGENGEYVGTLDIVHGQTAIIKGIPAGADYSVEEVDGAYEADAIEAAGYKTVAGQVEVDADGQETLLYGPNGTIKSGTDSEVLFTNDFLYPEPATFELNAVKVLEGADLTEGAFEFELKPVGGAPMPETDSDDMQDGEGAVVSDEEPMEEPVTAKNDAEGKVVFPSITMKQEDVEALAQDAVEGGKVVYTYQIREVEGDAKDVIYDEGVVNAEVTIEKGIDGELIANISYVKNSGQESTEGNAFVNVYDPELPNTGGDDPVLPSTGDNTPTMLLSTLIVIAAAGVMVSTRRLRSRI